MEDLSNIWNADDELNEEQLMNYVKGKVPAEEAHAVERKMAGSSFVNDAVEGLQNFSSSENISASVQEINEQLHQRLTDIRKKKTRGVKGLSWEIIAVIIVIVLCLIGYIIVEMIK